MGRTLQIPAANSGHKYQTPYWPYIYLNSAPLVSPRLFDPYLFRCREPLRTAQRAIAPFPLHGEPTGRRQLL